MKYFPELRTKRLTLQLRELSISESVKVASIPEHLSESANTAFLRLACERIEGIENPANWTVYERIFAITHYLASISKDGPDFSVGNGHYLDYLDSVKDGPLDRIELGDIAEDFWLMQPLTGAMAEVIERLAGEVEVPGRLHWILGGMAAQLIRKGEELPEINNDYDQWLLARMRVFGAFPESNFEQLMGAYLVGLNQLSQFFEINFDNHGIVVLPKQGADGDLPPARFPRASYLTKSAIILAG